MELKDMDYTQIVEYCAGQALMDIAKGTTMRGIVANIFLRYDAWRREKAELFEAEKVRLKKKKKARRPE